MVAINFGTTEAQAEVGKKGKASNAASDLFTQLLNNALEKQKQPTVLDPKQALQNAQKGDFGALTQEVLKSISKQSEPQKAQAQDTQKLNLANKAYGKAQNSHNSQSVVANRNDSKPATTLNAPLDTAKQLQTESKALQQTKKETPQAKTENPKTNAKDLGADEQPKDIKTPKLLNNKGEIDKNRGEMLDKTKDLRKNLADKEETKRESIAEQAKEKVEATKQQLQKTDDALLTSMLRNAKQQKDSKDTTAQNKKELKENQESAKNVATKDIKDSKEKVETKNQTIVDSKSSNDSQETAKNAVTRVSIETKDLKTLSSITSAKLSVSETKNQKELKEDLENTLLQQKQKIANATPQDSLHIGNRIAKVIEKLLTRYQSDNPNAIAGALKQGIQFAALDTKEIQVLTAINKELAQNGINLREILLQALEELQGEQKVTKDTTPKATTHKTAEKVTTQLVQDIKNNLRDTILTFIGKDNKEMPQTILGMSKGISKSELTTDIKEIVQKIETMLQNHLNLSESETKAIAKEILIQNLLKDTNTTKIAFNKKDLLLLRAQSRLETTPTLSSNNAAQNEVLNKILGNSSMSLSLVKELAPLLTTYKEQTEWLQKFAEFTELNLEKFQFSTKPSMFNELGAKNPLLIALLQNSNTTQKPILDLTNSLRPNVFVPTAVAPKPTAPKAPTIPAPEVKHPLTAKLAELNAKTAALVGAKPDFRPNDTGKISLEELIIRERLAIEQAVAQTKTQTTTLTQPSAAETSVAKTIQAFKEEVFKEAFAKKNDDESEEETILSAQTSKSTTKTSSKKTTAAAAKILKDQENAQKQSINDDKYHQNNTSNEQRPNSTHSNNATQSETLKWEQNEYEKQQINQQESQKLQNQNATLLTPENKKKIATGTAKASILDVLGAKITQTSKEKESAPQAVVIDAKTEIAYRSAAARETLRNFTGSLREGINNYKPPLSKLSIELSPEHLGNVEVTLKQRGTQLIVQIHSNPQALQLFMANANEFKQQLFGIGYENIEMTFQDADGNSFSDSGGNGGGGGYNGENGEQQQHHEHENEESTLEELQKRQEMVQEIGANGRTWNTFGLQAYKNSDSVIQKLRFLELTLTPKYA